MIYLDNNSTTMPSTAVVQTVSRLMSEDYGNPSSPHHFGARVHAEIEQARERVAQLIGARDREITFTSGATESNNAAMRGILAANETRRHLVISAVEHRAVIEPAQEFERVGFEVTRVPMTDAGTLDMDHLRDSVRDDTAFVALMLANNETGAILPVAEAAEIAHAHGALLHCDATQAVGKIPVDVDALRIDTLALSGHKMHGPKGVGALYVRRGTRIRPFLIGGAQERGRRGGTLNAPGIVGLGVAAAESADHMDDYRAVAVLRDRFEVQLRERVEAARIIAGDQPRLPNTSCVCFAGVESEPVVLLLSQAEICVSSGAACSSGSLEPSHVLQALRIDPQIAQGQIRFSLSRFTEEREIDTLLDEIPAMIAKVAALQV